MCACVVYSRALSFRLFPGRGCGHSFPCRVRAGPACMPRWHVRGRRTNDDDDTERLINGRPWGYWVRSGLMEEGRA